MTIINLPNDDKARLARVGLTGPDTPITLKDMCDRIFFGTITVATLKAEHQRGNLVLFKIGRQYFTSLNEVHAMMEKCRLRTRPRSPNVSPTDNLTEEARLRAALASLKLTLEKLKAGRKKSDRPPGNPGAVFLGLARKARHKTESSS